MVQVKYTYVDLWAMKCGIARPGPTSHELRIKQGVPGTRYVSFFRSLLPFTTKLHYHINGDHKRIYIQAFYKTALVKKVHTEQQT